MQCGNMLMSLQKTQIDSLSSDAKQQIINASQDCQNPSLKLSGSALEDMDAEKSGDLPGGRAVNLRKMDGFDKSETKSQDKDYNPAASQKREESHVFAFCSTPGVQSAVDQVYSEDSEEPGDIESSLSEEQHQGRQDGKLTKACFVNQASQLGPSLQVDHQEYMVIGHKTGSGSEKTFAVPSDGTCTKRATQTEEHQGTQNDQEGIHGFVDRSANKQPTAGGSPFKTQPRYSTAMGSSTTAETRQVPINHMQAPTDQWSAPINHMQAPTDQWPAPIEVNVATGLNASSVIPGVALNSSALTQYDKPELSHQYDLREHARPYDQGSKSTNRDPWSVAAAPGETHSLLPGTSENDHQTAAAAALGQPTLPPHNQGEKSQATVENVCNYLKNCCKYWKRVLAVTVTILILCIFVFVVLTYTQSKSPSPVVEPPTTTEGITSTIENTTLQGSTTTEAPASTRATHGKTPESGATSTEMTSTQPKPLPTDCHNVDYSSDHCKVRLSEQLVDTSVHQCHLTGKCELADGTTCWRVIKCKGIVQEIKKLACHPRATTAARLNLDNPNQKVIRPCNS